MQVIKSIFKFNRSPEARWFLYVSIAFLMVVYNELSKYETFSEIPNLKLALIVIAATVQGLVAWRAFIDQSISRADNDDDSADKPSNSTTVPPTSGS